MSKEKNKKNHEIKDGTSESKKILIADNSKLVKTYLSKILEDKGYSVIHTEDAFNTIVEIQKTNPACVFCSTQLPLLNGFETSRIIKSRENLNTPVVLYSISDDTPPAHIISDSLCDRHFIFDADKPEEFVSILEEVLSSSSTQLPLSSKNEHLGTEENVTISSIKEITGFYQKESENLNIVHSIFSVFENSENPRAAALGILDILLNFVPYDIALLSVCNNNKIHEFCRLNNENLTFEEISDFMEVSHNKVLNNCDSTMQMHFLDCLFNEEGTLPELKSTSSDRIKSTETAFLYGENFIGALSVGSIRNNLYTEIFIPKFQFFAEKLTPFLMNILSQYKIKNAYNSLRKVFSSFVPEEIIDDLLEKANVQTETAGEKRRVAVLICDIRNFTNISEKNKAENVVSFLNSYFTPMVEIIKRHGGSIDKFMGDAIMALFGAPISYEDNAQRAVDAALEMIEMLPKIDSSILSMPEGYDNISIGIGIHYGEVILGSIGCAEKKDYTVIGDSVNLASRMEGLTKLYGSHILISDFVKQELNSSIQTHRVDKVTVKGKKIPVWIYTVETEKDKETQDFYKNYDKAMELYEVGAWALARDYFYKAMQISPENKAAKLLWSRCQEYILNPPENWDGAVVLTSK
ncbi:MAG: adenylate/guanylate cyclase domain-containing response regulator [Treponema sp.]|nr:adenylate/guanylate cyclase domain-containing response regulator [Treponema sp.]